MKTWDLGFQFSLAGRQSWNMGLWHLRGAVKDLSCPSFKSNNTDNVVLSDIFCNPPPPQWPYHSRSERCAVSFKMQPCYGLGRNFVSSLFQLTFKVGWLARSRQGLQSPCKSSAQVTSVSSFYPREIWLYQILLHSSTNALLISYSRVGNQSI